MINDNIYNNNGKYHSFSKGTIFENSEWVHRVDLCSSVPKCAEIVNQVFDGKVTMNQNGEIWQLENGRLSPEERLGLARIFNDRIHRFKFLVSKDDFEKEVFNYPLFGSSPYFRPNLKDGPKDIMFSVKYYCETNYEGHRSVETFNIECMLYDFGKSNLLNEHWDESDKWLHGSFDKNGKVIGKISVH